MKPTTAAFTIHKHHALSTPVFLACLMVSAPVGFLILPSGDVASRSSYALLSSAILVFAWATFHLIRPVQHSRGWDISEYILIPLLWLGLITSLTYWFIYVEPSKFRYDEVLQNLVRLHPL